MTDLPGEIPAGVYQHYKGEHYLVLGIGHDANADILSDLGDWEPVPGYSEVEYKPLGERVVVVYVPLYMAPGPRMAVRTFEDFFSMVKTDLGEVPRFRYVGPGG